MNRSVFKSVWYLPSENRWGDGNLLAFRDVGVLTVASHRIEFEGRKGHLSLDHIRSLSIGKQGRDPINDWVRVEYGPGKGTSAAYFADGSLLGWGGVLGGSRRILEALLESLR